MRQQHQQQNSQPPEYTPGTTVFAKLKGYPWWPARIEADHSVPAKVLKQKSKAKNALYTVFFYGSRDYGFFGPDAIRPFNFDVVESDLKAKKFKTKDLEMAVRQALNPALLAQIEQEEAAEAEAAAAAAAAAAEEEEEEEEEEEDEAYSEEDEPVTTSSSRRRNNHNHKKGKSTGTTRKNTTTLRNNHHHHHHKSNTTSATTNTSKATKRRSRILDEEEEEEMDQDDMEGGSGKRSKNEEGAVDETAVGDNIDRKRRRKSMSLEKEEMSSPLGGKQQGSVGTHNNHSTTAAGGNAAGSGTEQNKDDIRKTPEFKKVYQIRHKLQKLVYNKKEGEIPKEDYPKILDVIKEIEEAPMSYSLLKDTKIGKVVKAAICYPFDDEHHVIKDRCQQLMRNWKTLLIDPQSGLLKPGVDRRKSTTPADEAVATTTTTTTVPTAPTATATTTTTAGTGTPMEED